MISSLTALFILFAVVIGSTAMVGVFAYILSRVRRLESGSSDASDSRLLTHDLSELRDEVTALRDEVSGLTERIDFTERLLMKGGEERSADTD
jgi:hypothetical protein